MISLVVGMIRMGLDFARRAPYCGSGEEDTRFEIVSKVDFLHFAIILAGVSTIAMVVISLFTKPRDEKQVDLDFAVSITRTRFGQSVHCHLQILGS